MEEGKDERGHVKKGRPERTDDRGGVGELAKGRGDCISAEPEGYERSKCRTHQLISRSSSDIGRLKQGDGELDLLVRGLGERRSRGPDDRDSQGSSGREGVELDGQGKDHSQRKLGRG